jgi:aspartyl-tRNA(Asn)/glutamyl-tRNA(Gln) amidotransferase subunit A
MSAKTTKLSPVRLSHDPRVSDSLPHCSVSSETIFLSGEIFSLNFGNYGDFGNLQLFPVLVIDCLVSSSSELAWLDLSQASQEIQKRTISPVELTRACLERIEHLDPQLNAFITVTADSALKEASAAEKEISEGKWRGPLHGIPMAVKDLIETAHVRTTAASRVLESFVPTDDAPIVQRLREAGVVLLGKLNLHEFAYGGSSVISHFGVVKNPWNTAHITGGSSSGSAAAVAAGLCYGAIGTDTAGSIRLPASCCGIVGLKPSYGLVSTRGVIPLSWTHDHAGPMARTVADAALVLQAIASYDPEDIYSHKFPAVHYPAAMEEKTSSLRLGVPHEFFWQKLDSEIAEAAEAALKVLARLTADAHDVDIPIPTDTAVFRCEPFVYHQKYLARHADEYHPETLRRIRSGAEVTATEYVDGYRKLQQHRREILRIFDEVDLLITPTTPILPPTIAGLEAAPEELRPTEILMLRNTRPFNVFGLPAISIPCGYSQSGLPIGLQISGAPGAEGAVLTLARAYEAATDWRKRKAPL